MSGLVAVKYKRELIMPQYSLSTGSPSSSCCESFHEVGAKLLV
jgi:hypothetical protein